MYKFSTESNDRIAIGAIFKNEGPYILEWIAAHQAVGFHQFYIADNNSTDGSSELLKELDKQGVINYIPFPGNPATPPQLDAYAYIMKHHCKEFDWIGFIDADEYLSPTTDEINIAEQIIKIGRDRSIGGVVVNWAIFGSSNLDHYGPEPTPERFILRANQDFMVNKHYKSFIKSSAYLKPYTNPHLFVLKKGFKFVGVDGQPTENDKNHGPGLSENIIWQPFRLNHYIIRSRQEFEAKKKPKGSATDLQRIKGEAYFVGHDKNDVADLPVEKYVAVMRNHIKRLIDSIPAEILKSIEFKPPKMIRSAKKKSIGRIDSIDIDNETLVIKGWSTLIGTGFKPQIQMGNDSQEFFLSDVKLVSRPDVAEKFGFSNQSSGFEASIEVIKLDGPFLNNENVKLWCETEDQIEELKIDAAIWQHNKVKTKFLSLLPVPDIPLMPADCTEYLKNVISENKQILEYGAGGSTIFALRISDSTLVTTESDANWLKLVNKKVGEIPGAASRLHALHADIGETKEWGYPTNENNWKNYWKYPIEAWNYCAKNDIKPTVVLIDGRFRRACFMATLINSKVPCTILFDDYLDRPHYHSIEKFLQPSKIIDRLAVFEFSSSFNQTSELLEYFCEAITDVR